MKCPVHSDVELREEYREERTGFCSKCSRHHKFCNKTQGTVPCNRFKGHSAPCSFVEESMDELAKVKKELEEVRTWQRHQQQGILELGGLLMEHFIELGGIKMPEGSTTHDYVKEATARVRKLISDRDLFAARVVAHVDVPGYLREPDDPVLARAREVLEEKQRHGR